MSDDGDNPSPPATTSTIPSTGTDAASFGEIAPSQEATTVDLQRPVKRARTAYFLFLDDYRSAVQKEVCSCLTLSLNCTCQHNLMIL